MAPSLGIAVLTVLFAYFGLLFGNLGRFEDTTGASPLVARDSAAPVHLNAGKNYASTEADQQTAKAKTGWPDSGAGALVPELPLIGRTDHLVDRLRFAETAISPRFASGTRAREPPFPAA